MSKKDFDTLLLQAVDGGLSSMGESCKQAIYFHLENCFDIKKQEIPDKAGAFACAIENIFGPGANFLEILIMKKLHEKVGGHFRWQSSRDFTFAKYVSAARRSFLKRMAEETVVCEQAVAEC